MTSFIKKYFDKIFLIFLFIGPLLDVITGLMINTLNIDLTIGIYVRILFLLFIVYYGIFIDKDNIKKKVIYLVLLGIYSLLFCLNVGLSNIFLEMQNLVKILYFPIILLFVNNIKIDKKYLIQIMCIYALLVFVPSILGLGYDAYTQGKVGLVGWFNSANEVSAIMSILFPILFVYSLKFDIKKLLYLLVLIPMFMIGSKILIVSILLTIFLVLPTFIKKDKIDSKKISIGLIIFIVVIILSVILIPKTNFYKNIIIHTEFLGINEFSDIFSYDSINRFIFSDRLTYLENTHEVYMNSDLEDKFIGIGFTKSSKMIEMDIFDIFYRLGIIGFILCMYPIVDKLKFIKFNKFKIELISLLMIIILSLLVGHTLTAPAVSIFVVVIIKNLIYNKKKVIK